MEAKLIKKGDVFFLDEISMGGLRTIANSIEKPDGLLHHLSLKNCKVIENGYDLDELAGEHAERVSEETLASSYNELFDAYEAGFQKALELIGDKKFSEEQVLNAFYAGWISKDKTYPEAQKSYKGYLKRRVTQQTEWDVEVVEECLDPTCDGVNRKGECITTGKPKLDADGCLILKRLV